MSDHGDPWSAHHYRVVMAIVCCLVIAVIIGDHICDDIIMDIVRVQ